MEKEKILDLIHKMEIEYESCLKKCDFIEEYLDELKNIIANNENEICDDKKIIIKQKPILKTKEEKIPWETI